MIQAKFGLNWSSGFRGEDFLKSLQTDDGRQVMAIAHIYEEENQIHRSATIYKRWVFCCKKRHFFICRWIIEGGCYNAEFVS
jgi:hypothetical protein